MPEQMKEIGSASVPMAEIFDPELTMIETFGSKIIELPDAMVRVLLFKTVKLPKISSLPYKVISSDNEPPVIPTKGR